MPEPLPAAAARASRLLAGLRRPAPSPAQGRWLLIAAVVLFAGAFAVALRSLPDAEDVTARWPILVVVAVLGVPATMVANAVEYRLTATWNGHAVTVGQATEVAVLASAGNLLPIPGAALVRTRALHKLGSTVGRAASATAIAGVVWLATTLLVAGALLLVAGSDGAGLLVPGAAVAGGAILLGLSAAGIGALQRVEEGGGRPLGALGTIVGVELLAVVIGVARYAGVMAGLSIEVSLAQAAALTVSIVAASALGFLPGGLGLRELLGAAIAPLVGLPASLGLLVVAVDRLVALPVLALMAAGFAASASRGHGQGAEDRR